MRLPGPVNWVDSCLLKRFGLLKCYSFVRSSADGFKLASFAVLLPSLNHIGTSKARANLKIYANEDRPPIPYFYWKTAT